MKKLVFTLMAVVCFASCDGLGGGSKSLQAKNDSLMTELSSRDAELEDMMGTFNQITEGFRQISAAENRVDLQRGSVAEGSANAKQQIIRDIEFIQKTMQENREQIEKLNSQLASSKYQNSQLKKTVESFTKQLEEKAAEIASLQEELMAKNVRIQELDELCLMRLEKIAHVAAGVWPECAEQNVADIADCAHVELHYPTAPAVHLAEFTEQIVRIV